MGDRVVVFASPGDWLQEQATVVELLDGDEKAQFGPARPHSLS